MAQTTRPIVTITEHRDDAGHHVVLRGRIDVRTVPDLRMSLHRLIGDGSEPILVDLAEVHIGDATGFGLLVECLRRSARRQRALRVVDADERTQRLIRRARLGQILHLGTHTASTPRAARLGLAPAAG